MPSDHAQSTGFDEFARRGRGAVDGGGGAPHRGGWLRAYGRRKDVSRPETTGVARSHAAIAPHRQTWLVVYRTATDVVAKGSMFAITVAAARTLPRAGFALFAVASTLGWLASVAADFGIQAHLAREVAQHTGRAAALLRRWLPVRLLTGLPALLGALAATPLLGLGPGSVLPILLFTLGYGVTGLSECVYYFFRGLDRTDLESGFTVVQRLASLVLALVALWWRADVVLLATALLVPAVGTFAAVVAAARRLSSPSDTLPSAGAAFVASSADTAPVAREFAVAVAPIGIAIVLSALYFRIDVLLLERWSGSAAVALYNAVFRIVDALRLFPAALLAVALPSLCRARDLRPLVRLAAPLTAGAAGAALVLWIAAPRLVPGLYGTPFAGAVGAFRILLAALPLMALNYALTQQVVGWHGQRAYALVCAAALGGNVLLNWRLIPSFGMGGAAWSTVATEFIVMAGCVVVLSRLALERAGAAGSRPTEARG